MFGLREQLCFKLEMMCKRYCLTEAYFSFLIPHIRTQLTDPTTTQIHCAEMPLHFTFQTTTHTVCMKMT